MYANMNDLNTLFDKFSGKTTRLMGNHWSFVIAALTIIAWGVCGPIFGYSQAWQMIINTGTTIITFLMVFIIQQSQNKDTLAVHLKLDELIRAIKEARDDYRAIEDKTSTEIEKLKRKDDETE